MPNNQKLIRLMTLSEKKYFRGPTNRDLTFFMNTVGWLFILLFVLIALSACEGNNEQGSTAPVASIQKLVPQATELAEAAQQSLTEPDSDMEAADEEEIIKVVYHADFADPRRFSAMLTSINNMVTTYQNDFIEYDVRIVFIAHGIRFVTDDKLANTPFAEDAAMAERRDSNKGRLLSLREVQEVKLELCNITRSEINLAEEAVYENVDLVPSGVVRIAELQNQGFAYIKIE